MIDTTSVEGLVEYWNSNKEPVVVTLPLQNVFLCNKCGTQFLTTAEARQCGSSPITEWTFLNRGTSVKLNLTLWNQQRFNRFSQQPIIYKVLSCFYSPPEFTHPHKVYELLKPHTLCIAVADAQTGKELTFTYTDFLLRKEGDLEELEKANVLQEGIHSLRWDDKII